MYTGHGMVVSDLHYCLATVCTQAYLNKSSDACLRNCNFYDAIVSLCAVCVYMYCALALLRVRGTGKHMPRPDVILPRNRPVLLRAFCVLAADRVYLFAELYCIVVCRFSSKMNIFVDFSPNT